MSPESITPYLGLLLAVTVLDEKLGGRGVKFAEYFRSSRVFLEKACFCKGNSCKKIETDIKWSFIKSSVYLARDPLYLPRIFLLDSA